MKPNDKHGRPKLQRRKMRAYAQNVFKRLSRKQVKQNTRIDAFSKAIEEISILKGMLEDALKEIKRREKEKELAAKV